jgi:hypothetical protein
MSYATTGSDKESAEATQIGLRVVPTDRGIDSGLSTYGTYHPASGSPERPVDSSTSGTPIGSQGRPKRIKRETQQRRDLLRRLVVRASSESEGMARAAELEDATRTNNLSCKLRDTLQELWSLRSERGDDWGDILNALQIALEGSSDRQYTIEQCRAISQVIVDHLTPHEADGEDIEQSVLTLLESGLDPWKGTDVADSST